MALQIFNVGLDALSTWTTATYHWVLLTAGTFDADVDTVSAFLAGSPNEVTGVASYAREAAAGKVRTVNDTDNRIVYSADNPDFGALEAGATVTAVLLVKTVTDDTDSIPVGFSTVTSTATDAVSPFTLAITDGVVAYVDQAA